MKQIINILTIVALVSMGALINGCNDINNDLDIVNPENSMVKTLSISISLDNTPATRALNPTTGTKTFAEDDKIAVIYKSADGGLVKALSDPLSAEDIITEDKKEAIFNVVVNNPMEGGPVRFIYPAKMGAEVMPSGNDASPYDDETVNYESLSVQDGTAASLNDIDLAIFDGSFTDEATLPASVQLKNQLAICEFTINNNEGDNITNIITDFTIQIGSMTYKVTPSTSPFYLAIKPVDDGETFIFTATDGSTTYLKSVSAKLVAGNIYPVKLTMAPIGDLIIGKDSDTEKELLEGGKEVDVLFGDRGIIDGLAQKVANATGENVESLTDNDILLFIFQHPDVISSWPGADNSETDPNTGDSMDSQEVLFGGPGSDILFAQGNNDILFGDASTESVADWLNLIGYESFSNIETMINAMDIEIIKAGLSDLETINDGDILFGGDGSDMLFGLGGSDMLRGGKGDDMLLGGSGDDTLYGDDGNDYLDGGDGIDFLYGGTGADILRFDANDKIDGGDGIDILLGNSSDASLYNLLSDGKVNHVEIFLKLDQDLEDIDGLDLVDLDKLAAGVYLNVSEEGCEISLSNPEKFTEGYGWNLNVSTDANGVTTIIFHGDGFTIALETMLSVNVDEERNEIILSL